MQIRLLHGILAAIILALVLGFAFIPTTWQMISEEPTFGTANNGMAIITIIASVAVITITLLSFKFVGRTEG